MRLVATTGNQTYTFPLREGSTVIGRQSTCHICIPTRGISRRHCQIVIDGGTVTLRDLGSSNGTHVNGQRVDHAELHDGDIITLGPFQLRFQAENAAGAAAGAAAAFAQAPGAAQGGVADAEPHYGEPADEEGAPAPTDFPESPAPDDTPVDGSFVPQAYTGPAQGYLPEAGPQLVVREGRWFLRDPRTGREVEIAPKEPAGVPGAPAAAGEARRPNTRLLIAAVAGAVILVIGFAVLFLSPKDDPNVKQDVYPTAKYNAIVDAAIADVREKKYDDALAKLDVAQGRRPQVETARLLSLYVRLIQQGGDYSLKDAGRYLDSMLNVPSVSDDTVAFAKEHLARTQAELIQLGIAAEAVEKLNREGKSFDALQAAWGTLRELPEGFRAAKQYAPKAAEIQQELANLHLERADRAAQARDWARAATYYAEAIPFVANPDDIRKKIADCQVRAREAKELEVARQDIQDQHYDLAVPRLKNIPAASIYHEEAQRLLAQVADILKKRDQERVHQQALDLYKGHAGPAAISLVKEHGLQDLAYIEQRVNQITQLLEAGGKAETEKDYEQALTLYGQAVAVEPDTENQYHVECERAQEEFKARFPRFGAELANLGYVQIDKAPLEARKLFGRALRFDPENARAKSGLEQLQRQAGLAYNQGTTLLDKGETERARGVLKSALEGADPGSKLYNSILQAIARLPKD